MFEPIWYSNRFCLRYVFQSMPVNLCVGRLGHLLYPSIHPETLLGQMGYIIPPACSGSTLGSSPWWTCLAYLHREASRGHLNQMPGSSQLAPFNANKVNIKASQSVHIGKDIPKVWTFQENTSIYHNAAFTTRKR